MQANTISTYIYRESINLNALSNDRFISLLKNATNVVNTVNLPTEHLAYISMAPITNNLSILDQILSSEKIELDRTVVDNARDADFVYLRTMLQANAISRDESISSAANSLLTVFNSFNINLDSLSLDNETEELDRVLTVWTREENTLHFESLGLTADLDKLIASVKSYKDFNEARGTNSNKQTPKVREVRRYLQKQFVMWLDLLEALANLNNDTTCYQCLKEANVFINTQSTYLKTKATRKAELEVNQ